MYVVALDCSSSFCKASLIDKNGNIVKFKSASLKISNPKEGWYEYDAAEILRVQIYVLEKVIEEIDLSQIKGIGISNQRETIVAWDKNSLNPICPSISWQDHRNPLFVQKYFEYKDLIRTKTGLYLSEYFSASKISWILENIDYPITDLRIGTIDSWLIANLTQGKGFFTDVTNASRTMLFNLNTESWDEELLNLFNIPIQILPQIKPSASCFGFWKNIPIYGVLGDQQAALLSLGSNEGSMICTYGTGLFFLMNVDSKKKFIDGLLTTVAWKMENCPTIYALEYSFFLCGNFLEKLKLNGYFDKFETDNLISNSLYLDTLNKQLFSFENVVYKSVVFNLDLKFDKGQKVLKSVLNVYALIVRDLFLYLRKYLNMGSFMYINGGVTEIEYLNRIQSWMLNIDLYKIDNFGNNTSLGVAYLVWWFLDFQNFKFPEAKKILYAASENFEFGDSKLIDAWDKYKSSL